MYSVYKIQFDLTCSQVFSETVRRIETNDIPADSVWSVDQPRPTNYSKAIMLKAQIKLQPDLEEITVLLQFDKLFEYWWKSPFNITKWFISFQILHRVFVEGQILDTGGLAANDVPGNDRGFL